MQDVGTCFGWRVQSDTELAFVRPAGAHTGPVLEVVLGEVTAEPDDELVMSWTKDADNPVTASVHRSRRAGTYRLLVDEADWYAVDPAARRITAPPHAEPVRREERLWGLPALLAFLARGDLPAHAAAVEVDGRAVLLAGPSQAGKTTLAAAASARGWRLLSEDLSCVRLGPEPVVLPGPAVLRLREDVAARVTHPHRTSLDLGDDRTHVVVDDDLRGDGDPVPVAAVLLLHPGPEVRVREVDSATALRDLWALSFRIPDSADRRRCFAQLAQLVGSVPVRSLERPLRTGALDETLDAVAGLARA